MSESNLECNRPLSAPIFLYCYNSFVFLPLFYSDRLGSIMDFMTFEQTTAFRAAFEDLYEIDLSEAEDQDEPFLNGTTFHGK